MKGNQTGVLDEAGRREKRAEGSQRKITEVRSCLGETDLRLYFGKEKEAMRERGERRETKVKYNLFSRGKSLEDG